MYLNSSSAVKWSESCTRSLHVDIFLMFAMLNLLAKSWPVVIIPGGWADAACISYSSSTRVLIRPAFLSVIFRIVEIYFLVSAVKISCVIGNGNATSCRKKG